MTDQALRFRLGLFVLASLVLLGLLILLFGTYPSLFKSCHTYTVTFASAPGVGPGTPVRRAGVRIGEVAGLELDQATGRVRVHLRVGTRYLLLRRDQPTRLQGLLRGDNALAFSPRLIDGRS